MNLPNIDKSGTTTGRKAFWDQVSRLVKASRKLKGRNVKVTEYEGKGTIIDLERAQSAGSGSGPPVECPTLKILIQPSGDGTTLIDSQSCGGDPEHFVNYFGHEDLCLDMPSECSMDTGVLEFQMFRCDFVSAPPDAGTLRVVMSYSDGNLTTDVYVTNAPEGDCCVYTFHTHRVDGCTDPGCEFVIPTGFGLGGFNITVTVIFDASC